ncbi:MAG: LCP family protein [Clostridia bacterium]|nr:LCP family protein [Clostridia bacterium]
MRKNNTDPEELDLYEGESTAYGADSEDISERVDDKNKKKRKKNKDSSKSGAMKPLKLIVILMLVFSVILIVAACVSNFVNRTLDVKDTNSELTDTNPDNQFLPTGFVFDETAKDSSKKSALDGFIGFVTGLFTNDKDDEDETPVKAPTPEQVKPAVEGDSQSNESAELTEQTPPDASEEADTSTAVKRKEEFYNFLVLAKDKGGGNTDTIMVASVDVKNGSIALLQIPRDTCVEYKGSLRKINSVYSSGYSSTKGKTSEKEEGGVAALSTCIVQNFGIVIDRYVIVDIEGFKSIVNTIGGVDVYVQQDMKYRDDYQNLNINLKKGWNHLDGEKAEDFVRFRKGYVNQDLGRMDAQKIFMSAFLKKILSFSTVTKAPELIGDFMKYVTTNVTLQEATHLGAKALEMGMSGVTMHNLQGTAGSATYYNGVSYFSPYKNANIDLVNKYFNVFNKDLGADNVNPKMLVAEYGSGIYEGGKTAEEIDEKNPNLIFSH